MLGGLESTAGTRVDAKSALGVATVFACVSLLARTISTLPLNVYRRREDQGREIAYEHPLFDLLHNAPNDDMTSTDFRSAMQTHLSLQNNAYATILKTASGRVAGLDPHNPKDVEPYRDRTTGELKYRIGGTSFASSEVLHLKGMTFDGLCGADMLPIARNCIGLAIALERNASTFFKNGSFPTGVIKHPMTVSAEAQKRIIAQMQASMSGTNAHKLQFLEEGMEYVAQQMPNRDSQFDESRNRQDYALARYFGVPPHKVGIVSAQPRANVEQENISFVTDTIRPIVVGWEQQMNLRLLTREERSRYFIEFNLSGLLRGDTKTRYDVYALAKQWGIMNTNEIRRAENMNPIGPEGDIYLTPLNMADAAQVADQQNNEPPAP